MLVIQNEFFDGNGVLNKDISDVLDSGIKTLVTHLLVALPRPDEQSTIVQMFFRQMVTSRLDLALAIAFIEKSIEAGQGSTVVVLQDPLKILEHDLDVTFEKVENGWCESNSAHDMLQTFSSMIDDAKRGHSHFSDDDNNE